MRNKLAKKLRKIVKESTGGLPEKVYESKTYPKLLETGEVDPTTGMPKKIPYEALQTMLGTCQRAVYQKTKRGVKHG